LFVKTYGKPQNPKDIILDSKVLDGFFTSFPLFEM